MKRTIFIISTEGVLYVPINVGMINPIIICTDGLRVVTWKGDKRAFLRYDDVLKWHDDEIEKERERNKSYTAELVRRKGVIQQLYVKFAKEYMDKGDTGWEIFADVSRKWKKPFEPQVEPQVVGADTEDQARDIAFRDFQKLFKPNVMMVWEGWKLGEKRHEEC